MWAPAPRVRSRPSNLHAGVRGSPSFPLTQRGAPTPQRASVERPKRSNVQSRTTQTGAEAVDGGVHLGTFGLVDDMTAETVDFLIRVLEDRKQELLVADTDKEVRVRATFEGEEETTSEVANAGAGAAGLGRSQSYESLVRLEGMLEARHHELMNDGLLEAQGSR